MTKSAAIETNGYHPAAFPEDVPTIQLETIPVSDLYKNDPETTRKLFAIFCNEGFFHLDLRGDPQGGQEFYELSNKLHDAAKDIFNNNAVSEKETWKGDPVRGILDQGYRAIGKDDKGEPNLSEIINVPAHELVHSPDFQLPPWLEKHRATYTAFAKNGDKIGQAVASTLERGLHLEPGSLASIHSLQSGSRGFVRIFRQPAQTHTEIIGPAHTDGNSITILFHWQGGFQIARPQGTAESRTVKMIDDPHRSNDEWLFVQPKPGHVLINLGDPMVKFSNGLLASGRHQVVRPPGEQGQHDRYSLLYGVRALADTPMRPLKSDVIPPETEEQKAQPVENAMEYAIKKVKAIVANTVVSGTVKA